MGGNSESKDMDQLCVETIRFLSVDGVQKANLGGFFVATKNDHFQNDAKPYDKRIDVFLR